MRLLLHFYLFLFSTLLFSQSEYLAIQKNDNVCLDSLQSFTINESLPDSLSNFKAVFLFSNARSILSNQDVERIVTYVRNGGGLYTGADNWPLQAESNQMTKRFYEKESFRDFENTKAEPSKDGGNLDLKELEEIPAGQSTVAFPMDYRLKVEAWIEDQPLILSRQINNGSIIIDGGYSRFYCDVWNKNSSAMLKEFIKFFD